MSQMLIFFFFFLDGSHKWNELITKYDKIYNDYDYHNDKLIM